MRGQQSPLANIGKPSPNYCSGCAKCCITHPCALAPDDLEKIARYFGLSEKELFTRFLVLDYVEAAGRRQNYVCPARKADKPGTIVKASWSFSDSPCIFLDGTSCSIQEVKPKGGTAYYCGLLTKPERGVVGYGKKRSARDWTRSEILEELLKLANMKNQQN